MVLMKDISVNLMRKEDAHTDFRSIWLYRSH